MKTSRSAVNAQRINPVKLCFNSLIDVRGWEGENWSSAVSKQ